MDEIQKQLDNLFNDNTLSVSDRIKLSGIINEYRNVKNRIQNFIFTLSEKELGNIIRKKNNKKRFEEFLIHGETRTHVGPTDKQDSVNTYKESCENLRA